MQKLLYIHAPYYFSEVNIIFGFLYEKYIHMQFYLLVLKCLIYIF